MEEKLNAPTLKRQREEENEKITLEEEVLKRKKSYIDIINLLEEEEDESVDDLSSLISSLQEEIISTGPISAPYENDPENLQLMTAGLSGSESKEGEWVMRHLLEASDDELGIPNMDGFDGGVDGHVDGGDLSTLQVGDGLWEFEDHEADNNYNHMLQHGSYFVV